MVSFNNDHNPYTPAFIENNLKTSTEREKEEIEVRYADLRIQYDHPNLKKKESRLKKTDQKHKKESILKAEPNHNYCSICKEHFSNYFTVIFNKPSTVPIPSISNA